MGAIIPAAGRAERFGSGENKIWAQVGGRTVLERTLEAFQTHPQVASIVLVTGDEDRERITEITRRFPKVVAVVKGGMTRAISVRNGMEALPPATEIVLAHDAARPLISAETISAVIEASIRVGAAVPGVPVPDTIKRTNSAGLVRATVPRAEIVDGETLSTLTAVQTPQGARLSLLRAAYEHFDFSHHEPTDEASLIEALGEPVAVVPGDATNIKITRREDLGLAERLLAVARHTQDLALQATSPTPNIPTGEIRTGFGYDVHAFAPVESGRKLFLGGVEIPSDRGLEGHSDADVLLHAICDAILGAASLGDIGILFPNTDEAYRGISSLRLLEIVHTRLQAEGWRLVNLDATVVAEAPKLMPHRSRIMDAIGNCLGLAPGRISVKATTSERMGFVGRGEGMACWAIATVIAS